LPAEPEGLETLQLKFAAVLLSRIKVHGSFVFKHLRCPHQKEEAIAEMVALAWKWFVRLTQRTKDATLLSSALARFAARAVRCGRRLAGRESARDVLSSRAQQRHRFVVSPLPGSSWQVGHRLGDALWDNTATPPDQQACFRIDFDSWTTLLCARDKNLIVDLALGERTQDLATKYGISAARVSQKRREFRKAWQRFLGDAECS
jgi:hypothetical protein